MQRPSTTDVESSHRCAGASIGVGDTVIIRINSGKLETYRLERHPIRPAELALASPLGSAILGRQVGATLEYLSPTGPTVVEIVWVR